ncbi:MAG: type II toxin-antitoxin system PemK/MazF family toxin [Thermomicrobiales bacterium]
MVLVAFPYDDLIHYKLRPALIVQADGLDIDYDVQLVAMITSRLHRVGSTRIRVDVGSETGQLMGLRQDSLIVVDRIAMVQSREIQRNLGRCAIMSSVDRALRIAFGLDLA